MLPLLELVCLGDVLCISEYTIRLQNAVDCHCDQCLQRHTHNCTHLVLCTKASERGHFFHEEVCTPNGTHEFPALPR